MVVNWRQVWRPRYWLWLAVRHRVLVNLAFVLVLAVGTWSYLELPRQQDPTINFNWIIVTTVLPGAAAQARSKAKTVHRTIHVKTARDYCSLIDRVPAQDDWLSPLFQLLPRLHASIVAVHDPGVVGSFEGLTDLARQAERLVEGQLSALQVLAQIDHVKRSGLYIYQTDADQQKGGTDGTHDQVLISGGERLALPSEANQCVGGK